MDDMNTKNLKSAMMPSIEQAAEIIRLRQQNEVLKKILQTPEYITSGDGGILFAITNQDMHQDIYRCFHSQLLEHAEANGYSMDPFYDDIDVADAMSSRQGYKNQERVDALVFAKNLDMVNELIEKEIDVRPDDYMQEIIDEQIREAASVVAYDALQKNPRLIEELFQGIVDYAPFLLKKKK